MSRVPFQTSSLTFLLSALLAGGCSSPPDDGARQDDPAARANGGETSGGALTPGGAPGSTGGAQPTAPSATPAGASEQTPPPELAPEQPPLMPAGGDGLLIGGTCYAACGFAGVTDPDGDGFGRERQATCVDPAAAVAAGAASCALSPRTDLLPPGPGFFTGDVCHPVCSSNLTDPDETGAVDGYGYERERSCVVGGSATALGGLPCDPMLPPLPSGDGISVGGECRVLCQNIPLADPDGDGYGYENNLDCVVSASRAALQGIPCDAPEPPEPPPPPVPPPGEGWNPDYTATMFGEVNCQPFGFDDPGNSNLNAATCVGRGAVQLNAQNQIYFGAVGDLSTLWSGGQCTCNGGQPNAERCNTAPGCAAQTNCGQCVEVTCNATGTYSFMNDGFTHNEFCRPGRSVVVQLLDACPHNHPNNPYWCTSARPNHIDVSCSAFSELAEGRPIGEIGSINVYVRPVDCSVGLGLKTF